MEKADIVIIGGGASGMAAAIAAKRENSELNVVILEKLSRVGKKILATGNGRCNFTHYPIKIEKYHGSAINESTAKILLDFDSVYFFNEIGMLSRIDKEGRGYPLSNAANTVCDTLRFTLENLKVRIICGYSVNSIIKKDKMFIIGGEYEFTAKAVILASGGCASKVNGTDGVSFRLAQALGIQVSCLRPSLTSIKTVEKLVKELKGVRVNSYVSLNMNKNTIAAEYGEVQFGADYLSGICVFNITSYLDETIESCELSLDLLPDYSYDEVLMLLKKAAEIRQNMEVDNLLSGFFNKRIAESVVKRAGFKLNMSISLLKNADFKAISAVCKNFTFPIIGFGSFDNAQVTAGGIIGDEIDENLQLKKVENLFCAGEALDVNGDCGGYNLHWAWSSGYAAGKNAAKKVTYGKNN